MTTTMVRITVPADVAGVLREDFTEATQAAEPADSDAARARAEMTARYYRDLLDQLDGPGDRTLLVDASDLDDLHEDVTVGMLEGLSSWLRDASTEERERVVAALAGWVTVMDQLDALRPTTA